MTNATVSSVQGPSQTPVSDRTPALDVSAQAACPECLTRFSRRHPGQLFCDPGHRDAWNNRAAIRGRVLTPLAIVARLTRDGTRGDRATGKRAAGDANTLIQQWRDDDRAAGRMDHPAYLAARYRAGFDPL